MPSESENSGKAALRARSVPYRMPFWIAVFYSLLHFLALAALVTALVWFLMKPTTDRCYLVIYSIAGCILTWLVAFFNRRKAVCPLCRGTPYLNSGAHPHVNAKRWWPINHGLTAICTTALSGRFQCMYCGNPYCLRKTPSRLRKKAALEKSRP